MPRADDKLQAVIPKLDQLLTTPELKAAFEEASAALEGARLAREFRESAGMTQQELADRLSVSQARISAVESGKGRDGPSYALLKRIASACKVDWPAASHVATVKEPSRPTTAQRFRLPRLAAKKPASEFGVTVLDMAGEKIGDIVQVAIGSAKPKELRAELLSFDPRRGVFVYGAKHEAGPAVLTGNRKASVVQRAAARKSAQTRSVLSEFGPQSAEKPEKMK